MTKKQISRNVNKLAQDIMTGEMFETFKNGDLDCRIAFNGFQ